MSDFFGEQPVDESDFFGGEPAPNADRPDTRGQSRFLPVPADDDRKMNPQVRFFEFISGGNWTEVFSRMGACRQAGEQDSNPLYSACQAIMAEVGYQHWARQQIVEALEPDSSSLADTLSAIADLRGGSVAGDSGNNLVATTEPRSHVNTGVADVELAVQRVLARVEVVPSELPVAQFLDLTKQLAKEIADGERLDGVPEAPGSSGDARDFSL